MNAAKVNLALLLCVIAARPGTAAAQGWSDYELQIDPVFRIVRANDLDVFLARKGGSVVYFHGEYSGVAPINGYIVTETHIFTRHKGRKARNLFAGDTFEDVDPTRTFYFIVDKGVASDEASAGRITAIDGVPTTNVGVSGVLGPFDEKTFLQQTVVQSLGAIQWSSPKNPNSGRPNLLGPAWRPLVTKFLMIAVLPLLLSLVVVGTFAWRHFNRRLP
jgi:hypothetical protein